MIIGKPAPCVSAFVAAVDDAIRAHQPRGGMSAMQRTWLAFCVTAVLVTNSICWARFARASLGTYSLAALEYRYAAYQWDRLPALAAELAQRKPEVLVISTTRAVVAAKQATTTIPIVVAVAGDLVELGIVASLARPGGNITGQILRDHELAGKRLSAARPPAQCPSRAGGPCP